MSADLINSPSLYESTDLPEIKKDKLRVQSFLEDSNITIPDLLNLTLSSGLTSGENYDLIEYGVNTLGNAILTYSFGGLSQFQIVIKLTSQEQFSLQKRAPIFDLLQENGDSILQENGDKLLIQGLLA